MIRTCEVGKYYLIQNKHESKPAGVFKCLSISPGSDGDIYIKFAEHNIAAEEERSNWEIYPLTPLMEALC
jgi:uncharacterized protein (DUF1919 family)